jgi:hypothetical protein
MAETDRKADRLEPVGLRENRYRNNKNTATIFKPTEQNKPDRPGIGGFGLEFWNRGDDMIFNSEKAISSFSSKVQQLHLVKENNGEGHPEI